MEKSESIKEVFKRYLTDQHSEEDFIQIQAYFIENDEGKLFDLIESKLAEDYRDGEEDNVRHIIAKTDDTIYKLISQANEQATLTSKPTIRRMNVISIAVAAVLCCIMSISLYFLGSKEDSEIESEHFTAHLRPGGNKATLLLGDGTILTLDSLELGTITEINGLVISKDEEGVITYSTSTDKRDTTISYSMLKTPLGGQYKVILEDGTKVWLNAASSLRYPSRFDTQERRVELIGEAFFEVKKDINKPFIVISNGQEVKVLGTTFNINTADYQGNMHTTLIEGSVEVSNQKNKIILTPGQQVLVKNEEILLRDNIDTKQVTAWKSGQFYFDGAKIEDIMYHLQKWYNIDVEYRGKTEHSFVLKISRDVNLSEILTILELTDLVHFKYEKNKIIVTP